MRRAALAAVLLAALTAGCGGRTGGALPTTEEVTGRFRSFEEARDAFLAIEPGKTTADELRALKIDPLTQGTELHSYPSALHSLFFHRGVGTDIYPPAVDRCLRARRRCEIWRVDQPQTKRRRTTFLLLDVLRFDRNRHTTGFDFDGVVMVLDGVAVFSLWGGIPKIFEIDRDVRPLGFLQSDVGFKVPRLGKRPVIFFEDNVDFDTELEGRSR